MQIDVFNGDADGICALIQLRLAQPRQAKLITGVKRDIELLSRVSVDAGDTLTVLDISLAKNCGHLDRILQQGGDVFYVDHHQPGQIPLHPKLKTPINTSANVCTSLLVNQYLHGQYQAWAVAGAFGDNLTDAAMQLATPLLWSPEQLQQVRELGICINYNGYGNSLADLYFAPDVLYKELVNYPSPVDFMRNNTEIYNRLLSGYAGDMAKANAITPELSNASAAVYVLPDVAWARRVSGVFGNELANRYPLKAHAIVTINAMQGYQISVRAPLMNKTGADELCAQFETGGGRKGAAGINHLSLSRLSDFIDAFTKKYTG